LIEDFKKVLRIVLEKEREGERERERETDREWLRTTYQIYRRKRKRET